MVQDIWKAAATLVAGHIRTHHCEFQRGLLLIPRTQDNTVIVWVFGNDAEGAGDLIDEELDEIRQRMQGKALSELGCGYSPDHNTWVMVLRTEDLKYETAAGKSFHLQMLKAWLDDTIQGAWHTTHTAESDAGMVLSTVHPEAEILDHG